MVPWARRHFGRDQWTLQQDSAPTHRVKGTQEWCKAHFPEFTSAEWPPYLFHQLQYLVNFVIQGLCEAPQKFGYSEAVVAAGVGPIVGERVAAPALNFRKRLTLRIEAEGGQFEAN